ncbi:FecR domain-containing protein [Pontibacter korlensis]|uniref:FecR domain-containing protein n=1 Tax=Pontibacter korlensis TaxID=400092 RepID=UPI00061AC169|nr:FecR domain-containing protein [Pontibacter korlensis]
MENHQPQFKRAGLILRHLQGELNAEEEKELQQWLEENEENRRFLDRLRNQQTLEEELSYFSTLDLDKAWQRIALQTVEPHSQTGSSWYSTAWKYAAAIALLLATVLAVYQFQIKKTGSLDSAAVAVSEHKTEAILPGEDRAKLTLSDGSVFMLDEMNNGVVREKNGVKVSKQDGQVIFELADNNSNEVFFNTISTPVGGQYQVVLPDGTKVWLNSASSLHFPSAFVGNHRVVELTGEGYFEVSKHKQKTFKVDVGTATVEVLGTHFNVMAYASEGPITTTLLEGSVKVQSGSVSKMMRPGQQASIGKVIQLREVDVEEAVAWKNGLFYFNQADIATVMRQLERWYGIEAVYGGMPSSKHFSGIISRDTELDKVLKMLALTGSVEFKAEGRKIIVSTK